MVCGRNRGIVLQQLSLRTECIYSEDTMAQDSWMIFTTSTSKLRHGPWLIYRGCLCLHQETPTSSLPMVILSIFSEDALEIREVISINLKSTKICGVLYSQNLFSRWVRTKALSWANNLNTRTDRIRHRQVGSATRAKWWRIVSIFLEAMTESKDLTTSTTTSYLSRGTQSCRNLHFTAI